MFSSPFVVAVLTLPLPLLVVKSVSFHKKSMWFPALSSPFVTAVVVVCICLLIYFSHIWLLHCAFFFFVEDYSTLLLLKTVYVSICFYICFLVSHVVCLHFVVVVNLSLMSFCCCHFVVVDAAFCCWFVCCFQHKNECITNCISPNISI